VCVTSNNQRKRLFCCNVESVGQSQVPLRRRVADVKGIPVHQSISVKAQFTVLFLTLPAQRIGRPCLNCANRIVAVSLAPPPT
jgi:hypothetical protein